jgi:glycosyltransferase involved in cell wall biosynthesis
MAFMKILIVNQHYEDVIGGSEIQCDLLAKYLSRFGHDVSYAAVKSKKNHYESPYPVIPVGKLHWFSLRKVLLTVSPDLVYWRFNKKSLLMAGLLCRFYKRKLVFSLSHINDVTPWAYKPHRLDRQDILQKLRYFLQILEQQVTSRINYEGYRFVDGVVSLREEFLAAIPSWNGGKMKKALIRDFMESQVSREFHWERPYVVWVASIKQAKNPELFIEVARRLHQQPVDFLMVGKIEDPAYRYLEDCRQLPPNLHYLGLRPPEDINPILQSSLFLVHTCSPEGFSNNFIQAWLQGKPTVSLYFDPDGFIEKHQIGYWSRTLDAMCGHIVRLVQDQALRAEMGERARRLAGQMFLPENNVKQYEDFFEEILRGTA